MKKRHTGHDRRLESYAQPHGQVAMLDLAHRHVGYPDAIGKLLQGPAPLTSRQANTGAQQFGRLYGHG